MGKCPEVIVYKLSSHSGSPFLWDEKICCRQVPPTPASAPPAGTRIVLKLEKAELLACFLLTFHFVNLNPFNYSCSSEQPVCTNLQHPAFSLFPGNAITACWHQLCLLGDTPSLSGFTFISGAGTFFCWERPCLGTEAVTSSERCEVGLAFDHLVDSDSMRALWQLHGRSTKASCQTHPFLLPAIQGWR